MCTHPGRFLFVDCGTRAAHSLFEPNEYLRARFNAGQVDLWIIYLCACGHGSHIRRRFHFAVLLRREVQKAKQ